MDQLGLTPTSYCSFYSTEIQPQSSTEIIKVMDQRLSLIEHRSFYLEWLMNKL